MLISQVLNDFVGEIKANINTEIQTRTLEENDLGRIKTKYGEEFLKSLVRAEVGVAMFQNAEYNNGKPYFVNFRPILHNTRRLSDDELQQYNDYNNSADDIGFQIEELEKLKVDVFDLKMELKLVKDKIMKIKLYSIFVGFYFNLLDIRYSLLESPCFLTSCWN